MVAKTSLKRARSGIKLPIAKRSKTTKQIYDDDDDDNVTSVSEPNSSDVLFGRGGGVNKHQGNVIYRRLVEANKKLYHSCTDKKHKNLLARSIVEAVFKQNGRFLSQEKNKGQWVTVGKQKSIQKTCQALREGSGQVKKEIVKSVSARTEYTKEEDEILEPLSIVPLPEPAISNCNLKKYQLISLVVPPKPSEVGKEDRIVEYNIEETDYSSDYGKSCYDTPTSLLDEEDIDFSSDDDHLLDLYGEFSDHQVFDEVTLEPFANNAVNKFAPVPSILKKDTEPSGSDQPLSVISLCEDIL
eukprot:CAMPEP_0178914988 /NCGR_PEP_ID=MMETSP0786-20121207/11757_1 /TAXON_ID=186022 /ORGANISM="Thalassionema frauenfeldii, Strain CCMP 1798" /LENGTH=298 /DNA_ID=CAMNT_0020588009 /DNA_START=82 /DNA_END=975 /DNA_ORIENTATION=-